ncbi:hypothetical protein R1flu_013572 [Riccia fluitans]|uniref:Uncharacterized protein n=1 Tax=Riccia fluitans TaxID=41844 RepID=A0ABD1YDM1_9MARC
MGDTTEQAVISASLTQSSSKSLGENIFGYFYDFEGVIECSMGWYGSVAGIGRRAGFREKVAGVRESIARDEDILLV